MRIQTMSFLALASSALFTIAACGDGNQASTKGGYTQEVTAIPGSEVARLQKECEARWGATDPSQIPYCVEQLKAGWSATN